MKLTLIQGRQLQVEHLLRFDKRDSDITNLSTEIEMRHRAIQEIKDNKYPLDDVVTIKRLYKWFTIDYNP